MLILLKIIYKAYYKTRNRRDITQSAFSGISTYFFTTTIFFLFLVATKRMFSHSSEMTIKLILGIIVFGLGFLTYFFCAKYVNKQFENERIYEDIKYSVTYCRFILFILSVICVFYFPGILFFLSA